jgi:hypothetical protein
MPPAQPQDPSATQAIPAEVAQQALAGLEDRKPVLTDAKRRADLAFAQFATDPAGAIAALEQLDRDFATHPMIQQALPICLLRAGQVDRAVAVAKSAVPFCMERGHNPLAAEIVKELRAHIDQLELNRDQLLTLGGALVSQEEWATAAKVYTAVIKIDTNETRAVKGMLQVAEGIMNKKHNPAAAAKIYRFLLKNCAASPLAEFFQQGLAEAEHAAGAPAGTPPAAS